MHLDAERLQRLLDRELDTGAESSIREHLDACEPCREQVTVAEREVAELNRLLGALDHPAPRLDAADVMRGGGRGLGWGRRAALIFLGLGLAGVAYAAPGSPVPGWLRAVTAGTRTAPARPAPAPAGSVADGNGAAPGISVSPGERMTVTLPSPAAGALADVSLGDSPDLAVRVVSGTASFSSGIDRLGVETSDSSAVLRIVVPRGAPWIEIRAGTARLFLKRGPHIMAAVEPGADGTYVLRVPPRRP